MKKWLSIAASLTVMLCALAFCGAMLFFTWNMVKKDVAEMRRDWPKLKADFVKAKSEFQALPLTRSVPMVTGITAGFAACVMLWLRLRRLRKNGAPIRARLKKFGKFILLPAGSLVVGVLLLAVPHKLFEPLVVLLLCFGMTALQGGLMALLYHWLGPWRLNSAAPAPAPA